MILVLTTLTHLLVLPFSPHPYYSALVVTSTAVSALWHYTGAPATSHLGAMDHLLALIWFFADMGFPIDDKIYIEIMILNIAVGALNPFLSSFDYSYGHSAWHLISALKAIYVANIISTSQSNNYLL
jgi:hypothetical protein